jgi:hypothetical protein
MNWQSKVAANTSGSIGFKRLLVYLFSLSIIFSPTCKPVNEKTEEREKISYSQAQRDEVRPYRDAYDSFFSQMIRTLDEAHQELVIINNTPPVEFKNIPVIVSEGMAYLKRIFVLSGDKENFLKAQHTFEKYMALKGDHEGLHRWVVQETGEAFDAEDSHSRYEEVASDGELDSVVSEIQAQRRFGKDVDWESLDPKIIKSLEAVSKHLIDRTDGLYVIKPWANGDQPGVINPGYVGIDDLDQIISYLNQHQMNALSLEFKKVRDRHYQVLMQFLTGENIHFKYKGVFPDWCVVKVVKDGSGAEQLHLYADKSLEGKSRHQGLEALRVLWRSIEFVRKNPDDVLSKQLLSRFYKKFELFDSYGDKTEMSAVDYMLKDLHQKKIPANLISNAFGNDYFDTTLKALVVFSQFSKIPNQTIVNNALQVHQPGFLPMNLYWDLKDKDAAKVNTQQIDDNSYYAWKRNPTDNLAYYMYSNSLLAAGDYKKSQKHFRGLIEQLAKKDFSAQGLTTAEYNIFENALGQYIVLFVLQGKGDKLIGEFSQLANTGEPHWMVELYLAQLRLLSDYAPEWQRAFQNLQNVNFKSFPYFYGADFDQGHDLENFKAQLVRDGLLKDGLVPAKGLKTLNAYLEDPGFYDRWSKLFPSIVLNGSVNLQLPEIQALREIKFKELTIEQKRKLVTFNRKLLGIAYPSLCPDSHRKPIQEINKNHFGLKQMKYETILKIRRGESILEKDLNALGNTITELETKARGFHYLARNAKNKNDQIISEKFYKKAIENYTHALREEREWSSSYWSLGEMLPLSKITHEEYLKREPERSVYMFKQEKLDLIKEWYFALQEHPFKIMADEKMVVPNAVVLEKLKKVTGLHYDAGLNQMWIDENFNETHLSIFKMDQSLSPYLPIVQKLYDQSFYKTPKALANAILNWMLNRPVKNETLTDQQEADLKYVKDILSKETKLDGSTLKKYSANLLHLQLSIYKNDGRYREIWQELLFLDSKYKRTAPVDFERNPVSLPLDTSFRADRNLLFKHLPFDGERERVYLYEPLKRAVGLVGKFGSMQERKALYLNWIYVQYQAMLKSRPSLGTVAWADYKKLAKAEGLSFDIKEPSMRQFNERMQNEVAQADLAKLYEIDIQKFYWAITDILNATTMDVAENGELYAEILDTVEKVNADVIKNKPNGHLFRTIALNIAIKKAELNKYQAVLKELKLVHDKKIDYPKDVFIPDAERLKIQNLFHENIDSVLELKDYQQFFSLLTDYYNFQLNGKKMIEGNRLEKQKDGLGYLDILNKAIDEKDIILNPFQSDLLEYLKGAALAQKGSDAEALKKLLPLDQKIQLVNPGDEMPGWTWMNIARVYLRQDNHQKVKEYLAKVEKNYPKVQDPSNCSNLANEYVDIQRYLNRKKEVKGDLYRFLRGEP